LSVCILTWNGEHRLPDALAAVEPFADEVVVGVDAGSSDRTLEIARDRAHRVFLFEHPGTPEPARLLFLDQVRSAWLLVLDDDERMEQGFGDLLPELLADERYTHYAFSRKWVIPGPGPTYARALPWFPDWQVRLFRNDPRIVWHGPASHSGYQIVGVGCREVRASIVHYERVLRPDREREGKVMRYRGLGGQGRFEEFYAPLPAWASVPLEEHPSERGGSWEHHRAPREPARVLDPTLHRVADRSALPPWGARLEVTPPPRVRAGEPSVAAIEATNLGRLRWIPPALEWPRLYLSYHVRSIEGEVLVWDGERTPMGRVVDPGASGSFLGLVRPPERPGDYVLEWDVVSEGECWFAECGSATTSVRVHVEPGSLASAAATASASPRKPLRARFGTRSRSRS
jgi:hypothetical protein